MNRHLTVLPGGATTKRREPDHPAVVAQESRRIKAAATIIANPEHPAHADMVAVLDLWAEVGA